MHDDLRPSLLAGLIGAGIQRSLSPAMHQQEGDAQGLRYVYKRIDLEALGLTPDALPELLTAAERFGFAGLNITHPCKQRVLHYLDDLSDDARALGAVNTVVFDNGRRIGHNTDWWGFAESFKRGLPGAPMGQVVQLGAGGAGAAVAHAMLTLGAQSLTLFDVEPERARQLAASLCGRFGPGRVQAGTDLARRWRRPTAWSTQRPPAWPATPACRCRPICCSRGTGWPRSSTFRWRPNCCAARARSAAARSTAAAWPCSRRWARSSCSPASRRMRTGCWPTLPRCRMPRQRRMPAPQTLTASRDRASVSLPLRSDAEFVRGRRRRLRANAVANRPRRG